MGSPYRPCTDGQAAFAPGVFRVLAVSGGQSASGKIVQRPSGRCFHAGTLLPHVLIRLTDLPDACSQLAADRVSWKAAANEESRDPVNQLRGP
jgi:hypothetical protein